jgi:mono/diheme cytochrome c family protein
MSPRVSWIVAAARARVEAHASTCREQDGSCDNVHQSILPPAAHRTGMNTNRLFARDLLGVTTAIAAVTTLALWLIPGDGTPDAEPPPAEAQPLAVLGAQVFQAKGCMACHTVDGTPRIGPTLLHDYGTQVALADGTTVAMDDAYIRESILSPQAKARPGYPPAMPTFAHVITDHEIAAVTAYIRSLR